MIIYMFRAVTMISDASGAVAELHIRIIQIRNAADLAFSGVWSIVTFPVHLPGSLFVIDHLRIALSGFLSEILEQPSAAEEQIVQHRNDGKEIIRKRRHNDFIQEKRRIDICQPFDLHGNDEEEQHLCVGEQCCEGKEHGQVDIGSGNADIYTCDEVDQESVNNSEKDTRQEIQRELRFSPILFQSATDKIVKIKHDQCQNSATRWNNGKCDQSPDLSFQDQRRRELQHADQHISRIHHGKQPNNDIADNDIKHQIRDPKSRMFVTE